MKFQTTIHQLEGIIKMTKAIDKQLFYIKRLRSSSP